MSINLYDPRELNRFLEERLPPRKFFRSQMFSTEETHTTENIDIDEMRHKRIVARFVHPKIAAGTVEEKVLELQAKKAEILKKTGQGKDPCGKSP